MIHIVLKYDELLLTLQFFFFFFTVWVLPWPSSARFRFSSWLSNSLRLSRLNKWVLREEELSVSECRFWVGKGRMGWILVSCVPCLLIQFISSDLFFIISTVAMWLAVHFFLTPAPPSWAVAALQEQPSSSFCGSQFGVPWVERKKNLENCLAQRDSSCKDVKLKYWVLFYFFECINMHKWIVGGWSQSVVVYIEV